jgi:Holliday junction resolvase RusA-like endonuclease
MNVLTNQFQESGASHSATDTAAAPSGLVSDERRGGQAPFHVPSEVVICLPLPPTTNNLYASNGRMRYRTSEYNAWIKEAGWHLAAQRAPQVVGKVSILIEVEEPSTAREMDLMNREKATTDLLVKHRLIQGDSNRYVRKFAMEWADIQGVRVTIRPVTT